MLSKPENGWTDFNIPGSKTYSLSYFTTTIPIRWLEIAVKALESKAGSFEVEAFMEPCWMVCEVFKERSSIKIVDTDFLIDKKPSVVQKPEFFSFPMMEFCKSLYDDISTDIDSWAEFDCELNLCPQDEIEERETKKNIKKNKKHIQQLLQRLKKMIVL